MALHNQTASTLSLARVMRSNAEGKQGPVSVDAESLRLILDTLIDLGQPSLHEKMSETAGRTVLGVVTQFSTAGENRGPR